MTRHLRSTVFGVLLLLASARGGTARMREGRLVVEDFERFVWGGDWVTAQAARGADPRMKSIEEPVHGGKQACRLDIPAGQEAVLTAEAGTGFTEKGEKPPLPLPGRPVRMGLWAFGNRSGARLWMGVSDSGGKVTSVALAPLDFDGWRYLEGDVSKLRAPLALRGLAVRGGDGPIIIDDISVTTRTAEPLHLTVHQANPREEFVEGSATEFHVVVQTLSEDVLEGMGEASAEPMGRTGEPVAVERFSYSVRKGEPCERKVRMRLPAGVYRVAVRAGSAGRDARAVVFPSEPVSDERDPVGAARGFGEKVDAVRIYESALSPAVVVETTGKELTLFRGLDAAGLTVPLDGLIRTDPRTRRKPKGGLAEPWMLLWFGASPKWFGVRFADGSPCPTFDVPMLVVMFEKPTKSVLRGEGLVLSFRKRGARVAVMPLMGIARPAPGLTTHWKEKADAVQLLAARCRFWASALRAMPIAVREERRINVARDEVEVRLAYRYLRSESSWVEKERSVAPVPPLLSLARRAGLKVVYSKDPLSTGCLTSVGPHYVVPDTESFSYTMYGLLRHVNRAVADLPAVDVPPLALGPVGSGLAAGSERVAFWSKHGGAAGRAFAEGFVRRALRPANARYARDPAGGLTALDGLAWQAGGELAARAATADQLRAAWYGGHWGGAWEPVSERPRHLASLAAALSADGEWATLGLGSEAVPLDVRLNAALFHARLAARLDDGENYALACGRFAKLLAAGWALAANAPAYIENLKPWFSVLGQPRGAALGRCLPGSVGFAPGPAPFVSSPSDGGYAFAGEHLREYLRDRFSRGPGGFYGRDLPAWTERTFVELDVPDLRRGLYPVREQDREFATNYLWSLVTGDDGWPRIVWRSHRSPAGGPLVLCGIGTGLHDKGKLRESRTVGPHFRMWAFEAIEAPPPAKETEDPTPPEPEAPPARPGGDTPPPDPPRSTRD